jgi:hypothetical protein
MFTSRLHRAAQAKGAVLDDARQREFSSFQWTFLSVQLVATFVDFIQGPYLYKVYESYGYGMVRHTHVQARTRAGECP